MFCCSARSDLATHESRKKNAAIPARILKFEGRKAECDFMVFWIACFRSANAPATDGLRYSLAQSSGPAPVLLLLSQFFFAPDRCGRGLCDRPPNRAIPGQLAAPELLPAVCSCGGRLRPFRDGRKRRAERSPGPHETPAPRHPVFPQPTPDGLCEPVTMAKRRPKSCPRHSHHQ